MRRSAKNASTYSVNPKLKHRTDKVHCRALPVRAIVEAHTTAERERDDFRPTIS